MLTQVDSYGNMDIWKKILEKDIEFTVKTDLTYGREYVYSLQYHLVRRGRMRPLITLRNNFLFLRSEL